MSQSSEIYVLKIENILVLIKCILAINIKKWMIKIKIKQKTYICQAAQVLEFYVFILDMLTMLVVRHILSGL